MLKLLLKKINKKKNINEKENEYKLVDIFIKRNESNENQNNVFQTYPTKVLPNKMKEVNEKIKNQNDDFNFVLFDDDDCRNFINEYFNDIILNCYDKILPGKYKADIWKLCVLYIKGGFFIDLKFEIVNDFKLSCVINNKEIFIKSNSFLYSKKNNYLLLEILNVIMNKIKNNEYSDTPENLTEYENIIKKNLSNGIRSNYDRTKIFHNNQLIFQYYDGYIEDKYLNILTDYKYLWFKKYIYKSSNFNNEHFNDFNTKRKIKLIDKLKKNYFNDIDKIFYINLARRRDRMILIENELDIIIREKIIRFNAIQNDYGTVGCCSSHLEILKIAKENNLNKIIIFEDDMIWNNFEKNYLIYEQMVKNDYDILLFGGYKVIFDNFTFKVNCSSTSHAYLIKKHYYDSLIENLENSRKLFLNYVNQKNNKKIKKYLISGNYNKYNMDEYWKILQKTDNWYIIIPFLCIQRNGYSDINNSLRNNWQDEFLYK
jgi:glycosyl transferase family 25